MSLKLSFDQIASGRTAAAELKLHLGCGANVLPGWVNTDMEPSPLVDYLDATKRFPFADNSFAAAFCEHLIEHMEKAQAQFLLQEVCRVLRPGGLFRVVTPSLENFARVALEPESAAAQKYLGFFRRYVSNPQADISDAINMLFYGHGHRHIYRVNELAAMFQRAGFSEMRAMPAGTYANPVFNGVDGHGKVIGEEINAIEAFAIEAKK
jgi:ubiquinone/menaquinone biosynthesis C-methylase UbiE